MALALLFYISNRWWSGGNHYGLADHFGHAYDLKALTARQIEDVMS